MSTVIAVGCVGLICMSLMFKTTLLLWVKLFAVVLHLIKWLFIIGFTTAFLNMPQMYVALGWTPLSLLVGPQIYDKALKISKPNFKRHGK